MVEKTAGKEFLIVFLDPDHTWCTRISDHLEKVNYKTIIVTSATQVLEIIEHMHPQVVVCDLTVSEDDVDKIVHIGTHVSPSIPIIISSANHTLESQPINDLLQKGAFDCLIKPYSGEILARKIEQAIQVNNARTSYDMYDTVNQKLFELQILSSYSEKLMGVVDKYDVIRSLIEISVRHFEMDFIGFLIAQRRTHEFLYWSRYAIDDRMLQEFSNETITAYNRAAETTLRKRKIIYTAVKLKGYTNDPLHLPSLGFRNIVPLCWDNLRFGAFFLGAITEPEKVSKKLALLSSLVGQTRIALTNTKLYGDMKENYIRTIKALAIAVDAKDTYTHGHSENVMNIAEEIARELSIDEEILGNIRDAGLLHDIGKIGIPGYILNKPGPLTYEEFNGIMKTHSTLGANIVRDVPFLRNLHNLILYHHEHYDGKGYPDGLKGEQIPIGARILHVADAFEAMTSNRPYRNSLGRNEAIRRLIEGSGKQFDPSIIQAFLRIAHRKKWLDASHPDTTLLPTPEL